MSALPKPAPVTGGDTLTVLKSIGPKLTKSFDGDTVIPYGLAKTFSVESVPVKDIDGLSMRLKYLAPKPLRCIIRGAFKGDAAAQTLAPPTRPGQYQRVGELFDETPHHWWCADHDDFEPMLWDPVTHPEEAIRELIESEYPPEFHTASYHWQLSASAGRKPGVLKVHLWWWLETAYTGPQIEAWVRATKVKVDIVTLRKIQVHYTAHPIFLNGTPDPMAGRRCGLHRGEIAAVPLIIPQDVLDASDQRTHAGGDLDLTDPTTKPGVIGAFCKAYPISRVIAEIFPDLFAYADGSDRRVTWYGGGGAAEGCYVTDDDWYLGNSHNTSPHGDRLQNAWDVVRLYKFGHLDEEGDADDPMIAVHELASHRAMVAWVEGLPEIKGTVATTAQTACTQHLAAIEAAVEVSVLRSTVAPAIQAAKDLEPLDRELLAQALKSRLIALTHSPVGIDIARDMVAPVRNADAPGEDHVPEWAKPWVFRTDKDHFFNLDTGESVSITGFNMVHDREMHRFMDRDGNIPAASQYCKLFWNVRTVAGVGYMPGATPVFEMLGTLWANSYSDKDIPAVPPVLTDAEGAAVAIVQAHLQKMLPDDRERELLIAWLAHNTRHPGVKIRWAPFLSSAPGGGKTFFLDLLGMVMGSGNVAPLDAGVLCKSDFTGWALGAAVRCIEEVKLHGENAHDITNKLKQFHTNNVIDVHQKGRDPFRAINKTNYLLLSNFDDGIPLEKGERRYFVLQSAIGIDETQAMSEDGYFKRLFTAVQTFPGAIRKWLLECPMHSDFDPDGHAPMTGAKAQLIELSKNFVVVAAEEIIEEGSVAGVSKHVISSNCLIAEISERTKKTISGPSVHALLKNLGYHFVGRVKWRSKTHRMWVSVAARGITQEQMRLELDNAMLISGFLE